MSDRDGLEHLFDRLGRDDDLDRGDLSDAPPHIDDDDYDAVAVERAERAAHEERMAQRRLAGIEAGRRQGGFVGAAMAGAMFAVRDIYEGRPQDADIVEQSESPDEPDDIDLDGITVMVDGVEVWAPPPRPDA